MSRMRSLLRARSPTSGTQERFPFGALLVQTSRDLLLHFVHYRRRHTNSVISKKRKICAPTWHVAELVECASHAKITLVPSQEQIALLPVKRRNIFALEGKISHSSQKEAVFHLKAGYDPTLITSLHRQSSFVLLLYKYTRCILQNPYASYAIALLRYSQLPVITRRVHLCRLSTYLLYKCKPFLWLRKIRRAPRFSAPTPSDPRQIPKLRNFPL